MVKAGSSGAPKGYHIHADPWREERYSYQEDSRAELEP